ncbi:MAG: GNAT family N-acetyltransferase [Thermoleophilaceae bacterium]
MELCVGDLLLRPPRRTDLVAVVTACSDPEIPRFIPFIPAPYPVEAGRTWLASCERNWLGTEQRTFAIVDRQSNRFLGAVTVRLREGGLVGFWLSREARGTGVMTGAVKAVVEWARTEHGIGRLCLLTHPDNVASQRVAEKAGFVRVGVTSHEPPFRDGTSTAIRFELT